MIEALALADGEIDEEESKSLAEVRKTIEQAKSERKSLIKEEASAEEAAKAESDREQAEIARDEIWEPTLAEVAASAEEERQSEEAEILQEFIKGEPAEAVDPSIIDPDCGPPHHEGDLPTIDPDHPISEGGAGMEEYLETQEMLQEVVEEQIELQLELLEAMALAHEDAQVHGNAALEELDSRTADILEQMGEKDTEFREIAGEKAEASAAYWIAQSKKLKFSDSMTDDLRACLQQLKDCRNADFLHEDTIGSLDFEIGRLEGEIGARNMNAQLLRKGYEYVEEEGGYAEESGVGLLSGHRVEMDEESEAELEVRRQQIAGFKDGLDVGYASEIPMGGLPPEDLIDDPARFAAGFGMGFLASAETYISSIADDLAAIAQEVASGEFYTDEAIAILEMVDEAKAILAKLEKTPYASASAIGEALGAVLASADDLLRDMSDFEKGEVIGEAAGLALCEIVAGIVLAAATGGAFAAVRGSALAARIAGKVGSMAQSARKMMKGAGGSGIAGKLYAKLMRKLRESALVRQLKKELDTPPKKRSRGGDTEAESTLPLFEEPLSTTEVDEAFEEMGLGTGLRVPLENLRFQPAEGLPEKAGFWEIDKRGMVCPKYRFDADWGSPPRDLNGKVIPNPPDRAPSELRIHSPHENAPDGSTSSEEWVYVVEQRIERIKPNGEVAKNPVSIQRMTKDGKWFDPRFGMTPDGKVIDTRPYRRNEAGDWVNKGTGSPVTKRDVIDVLEQWDKDMADSHFPLDSLDR